MSDLHLLIQAARSTLWAIEPETLAAIRDVLDRRADGIRLSPDDIKAITTKAAERRGTSAPSGNGIAVLPLHGIISHRASMVDDISSGGGTSCEKFGAWFDAAMSDPAIGAIVIDIDSPGGTVTGVQELADKIRGARGQGKKIISIANGLAASAAYWIGCAADEFWCIPSGDVGSIGVYCMHQDLSGYYEAKGVKNTLISAGKYKTEGNPYGPLSDEAEAAMQERVEDVKGDFTKSVATSMGVPLGTVKNGFGEGRVLGATKAKAEGMVHRVGTMETLLQKLGARSRAGTKAELLSLELVAGMEPLPGIAAVNITVESTLGTPITSTAGGYALPAIHLQAPAVAAVVPVVLPTRAAPTAKESSMTPEEIAAAQAAATKLAALEADAKRVDGLLAVAKSNKEYVSMEDMERWKANAFSIENAQSEVMDKIKANRRNQPVISTLDGGDNGTKAGPYRTLGENLMDIARAQGGHVPVKLGLLQSMHAAATGASSSVGADGGFLIQKDFEIGMLESSFKSGEILSRCDTTEISANADSLEVVDLDETSHVLGQQFGGVQVFRVSETPESVTSSKPQLGRWERRLEDMEGVAFMTDRLMADAPAMGDIFQKGFSAGFTVVTENEVYRATGAGKCKGILGSIYSATAADTKGPVISVAKKNGQGADTVIYENIQGIWKCVSPEARANGAWFINTEVEEQLDGMMIGTGTAAQLVFMPAGGISGKSYGTIKGRPVIVVPYASGLGDVGDIMFADFSDYKLITKGGIEAEESIHVRFVQREKCFRWVKRVNGAPKRKSPVTPMYATDTNLRLSSFVTLAAR